MSEPAAKKAKTSFQVGDAAPAVEVVTKFPLETTKFSELLADKKAILVGLPGAFTPT